MYGMLTTRSDTNGVADWPLILLIAQTDYRTLYSTTREMKGKVEWSGKRRTVHIRNTVDFLYLEHPLSRTSLYLEKFSGPLRVQDRESQLYLRTAI